MANGSNAAALANVFSSIAAVQPKKLVIHFPGRLVSRDSTLRGAQLIAPMYKNAGTESLFVVWERRRLK